LLDITRLYLSLKPSNYLKDFKNVKDTLVKDVTVTDGIKLQYEKLANDWRHFNTIIWGIPTVAVAIMATIVIAAYGAEVGGWPRIASLSIGSLLLFGLTIETVKKRQHMIAMSIALNRLQSEKLNLSDAYRLPLGITPDIDDYINSRSAENAKDRPADLDDILYNSFKGIYARKVLTWVVFIAAIVVALLADLEFVRFYYKQYEWYAIAIGIVAPSIIFVVILVTRRLKR